MKNTSQSIDKKILRKIRGHGRGWVFTPGHFQEIGSRPTAWIVLMRHKREGTIRQLARGLYDFPKKHPSLGVLTPSADAIAKALAARDATRLQPAGAYAVNLLGLSEQVPMKVVFLTDGPSRSVKIGKQTITLKRTTPKNMATAGRVSGLLIQALRFLGKRNVDRKMIEHLRGRFSDNEKKQLMKDIPYAPSWIAEIMRDLAMGLPS